MKRRGGCSSAGRAGRLVIGGSRVQIPAPGWAELHVEVSLSKILNPELLLMCSWHLAWRPLSSVRALRWAGDLSRVPCPCPEITGIGASKKKKKKRGPMRKGIKRLQTMDGWMVCEKKSVGYASWKQTLQFPEQQIHTKRVAIEKNMIIMLERFSCVTTGGVHCFPPASMLLPWHLWYVLLMCAMDREVLWGSEPKRWCVSTSKLCLYPFSKCN